MKSNWSRNIIIAVVVSATLLIGSGAEAASLLALGGDSASAERQQMGLFGQAIQWLNGAWSDLTSVFSFSEETPPSPASEDCTSSCGDAGPGIDPLG